MYVCNIKKGKNSLNINYKTMEKEMTKKRKERKKWDATLKWTTETINNEKVTRFEINGYPFFLKEEEIEKIINAIKDINSTAHFIITSVAK